jgi:thiamine-phosphate pyrophosphorylase
LASKGLDPIAFAAALIDGGAQILQFRHKQQFTRGTFEMLRGIAELCRESNLPLVINDRADLAAVFESGVHVGQEDLWPVAARAVAGQCLLGLSTHTEDQLRAAEQEPVDYVALGPIFATHSKDKADPQIGLDRLRAWRGLTSKPLAAIGGITLDNAPGVIEAGADSVAVIGALVPESNNLNDARARMETWIKQLK